MKKEVVVWKVLNYRTRASVGLSSTSPFLLKYPVGKFVKAKIGKIFCFAKKYNAMQFIGKKSVHWSIHKAIAINPVSIDMQAAHEDQIEKFWKGRVYGWVTPQGTLVCDALKCLE